MGVDPDGKSARPNGTGGISIASGAADNLIGGTVPGEANVIAYNRGNGVLVADMATTGNSISGNSVFANTGIAINLQPPGEPSNTIFAERPRCAANLAEANEIKLALRTSRLLDKVDEWDDEEALGEKSKAFFQLSRSVTSQLAERTRRERFKLDHDLKTRKQEISEEGKRKVFDLTAPLSKEQRDAILDKIDELLGIRLDPQDATPSSPSPRRGEGRLVTPKSDEGGGEVSPSSSSSSSSSSAPPAPSDSCSSASISGSTLPPSEMHSHALECRAENSASTSAPSPDSTGSDLLHASRVTHHASASSPAISPLSALAGSSSISPQPHDQVPVFDRFGAWIEWIPQDGPDSYPKFPNPIGFENRRKETICWINPKDPYPNVAAAPEDKICVINCQGRILYWLNKSSLDPTQPFYDAEPLRSRAHHTVAAWLAGWKESYVDPSCGALVG